MPAPQCRAAPAAQRWRPAGERSSSIPRTYDAALSHFKHAPGVIHHYRRFVLPSGNLYCAIAVPGLPAGCEISQGAIKDPSVCDVPQISQYVGRVEFRHGRATPICNTDTIRTPGAPVLHYGDAAKMAGGTIACLSETIGVTCISLVRTEGFFLHRGEYDVFNAG